MSDMFSINTGSINIQKMSKSLGELARNTNNFNNALGSLPIDEITRGSRLLNNTFKSSPLLDEITRSSKLLNNTFKSSPLLDEITRSSKLLNNTFKSSPLLDEMLRSSIQGKVLSSDMNKLLGLNQPTLTARQYKNNQLLTTKEFFDYQDSQPIQDQAALSPSENKTRIEERNNAGKAAQLINWDILVQEAENAASEDNDETNYPNINEDFYLENKKFDLYSPQLMNKIVLFSWNAFIGIGGVSASIEAILQVISFLKTH